MKKFILIFCQIFIFFSCTTKPRIPQTEQEMKENLIQESEAYSNAYVEMDAKKIVHYTNEYYVKDQGGSDVFLALLQKSALTMKERGDRFLEIKLSQPEKFIRCDSGLYCVLKQSTSEIFGIGSKKPYEFSSLVIANSPDSGIHWKFLGIYRFDEEMIKKYIPGFSMKEFGLKTVSKKKSQPAQ